MIGAMGRGEGASLLLAFVLLAGGCSRAPADDPARGAARPAPAPVAADTTRPEFPDAAPSDRQLPDPVRRALRRSLESWTLAWRPALPTLRLDQFARSGSRSFAAEERSVFDGSFEGADLRLMHLAVPSPDVLLVLDPYLDVELSALDGTVRATRGEEAGAVLIDLGRKEERRVLELDPGARVDGAHWLDASRAVTLVDEPAPGGRRPALYLIDVGAETVTRYAGPLAGPAEGRAARAELDRRFRAALPEVAF